MNNKIIHFESQGKQRINQNKCYDIYSYFQNTDFDLICLSDGVSNRRYTDKGAKAVHENINELLKALHDVSSISANTLKYRVACCINETIYQLTKSLNQAHEEFASTLMCVIIPKGDLNNSYYCVHIGDGAFFEVKNDMVDILSFPENGINKNFTYVTTSNDIYTHVRVKKLPQSTNSTIIAATDGVTEQIFSDNGRFLKSEVKEVLKDKNWNKFIKMISQNNDDDIGFFAIDL